MNKSELLDGLEARLGDRKVATAALDGFVDIISRQIAKGQKVTITGFGSFEAVTRPARKGRNPRTGETVKVKKTTVPKFKAGSQFKAVASGAKKLGREPKPEPLLPAGVTRLVAAQAAKNADTPAPAKKAAPAKAAAPKSAPAARATKATTSKKAAATSSKAATAPATKANTAAAKKTTASAKKAAPGAKKAAPAAKTARAAAPATKAAAKRAPRKTASAQAKAGTVTAPVATKAPAKRAAKKAAAK